VLKNGSSDVWKFNSTIEFEIRVIRLSTSILSLWLISLKALTSFSLLSDNFHSLISASVIDLPNF